MTYAAVQKLAHALPGVEDGSSYGTPALKVKKKLMARLKEDNKTLVLAVDYDTRRALLAEDAETFFITEHYRMYPWVLITLPRIKAARMKPLLQLAHARVSARAHSSKRGKS